MSTYKEDLVTIGKNFLERPQLFGSDHNGIAAMDVFHNLVERTLKLPDEDVDGQTALAVQ